MATSGTSRARMAVGGAVLATGYAGFQAALAAGAPLGRYAWGGGQRDLPVELRVASGVTVVLYLALARTFLRLRAREATPRTRQALRVAGAVFALGVPLNLVSPSPPERWHALGAAGLALCSLQLSRSPSPTSTADTRPPVGLPGGR